MSKQKKAFLSLVLLISINLFQLDASAQRKQFVPGKPKSAARITASPPDLPVTQKPNGNAKIVKESFAEALDTIRKNYIGGKKLTYNNLFKSAVTAMLRTLDPYSHYYDAEELDALKSEPRGSNYGIGLTIGDRRIGGDETSMFVLASLQQSPAANADLRFGDKIISVDNWDVKGQSLADARERLRGARGSQVKLMIERASDNVRQSVEIRRDLVPQPSVPDAYMLREGIGYIDLGKGLNITTTAELTEKLDKLHKEGMTSLVLDLRENTGGFLDQTIQVAEQFLSEGQIILTHAGRKYPSSDRFYQSRNRNPNKSPLVVLVSPKTASGAEMVAGALQDHDRALIVGETTFGQSLVQSVIHLQYGSGLTLTTSKIIMPSGRVIQRDDSNRSNDDNQMRDGPGRKEDGAAFNEQQHRAARKTDTGRTVYGGEGIVPDEIVKPRVVTSLEQMMIDPIFGFVRELVNGRINGFESYVVRRPTDFTHVIKPEEFAVTDSLFIAFKDFVARTPGYRLTEKQLDANREFIARHLRYDIVTAAYGQIMAARVLRVEDPQVLKAIEALPRAAALAAAPRTR